MLKIEWEEKHRYIMGEKIINGTQRGVVIYIDPYNSLYHLQKLWNSFRVCLASMYLLKQDVSLWFFWKLHQYVRDRAAQTGNCYFDVLLELSEKSSYEVHSDSAIKFTNIRPFWPFQWWWTECFVILSDILLKRWIESSYKICLATASSHWGHPLMRWFHSQLSSSGPKNKNIFERLCY